MGNVTALRAKSRKSPTTENRKVTRSREYLTPDEVDRLMTTAAKVGRYGHRDATLMVLTYRHGRVSEQVAVRWDQVDFKAGLLHVSRAKNGIASVHPLRGPERRTLRRLRRKPHN